MQLQIYQLSHPLIQIILNNINTAYISKTEKESYNRYIGFLIIYEIFRKYIVTKNLHIQLLEGIKKLQIIDTQNKYIILTNTSDTYSMITDIKSIMSNLEIIHVEYEHINRIEGYINEVNTNTYIFIIEKITKNYKIINLIDYLQNTKKISINRISIGNILSSSLILKKIGDKYPELKVYTTKVEQ